MFVVKDLLQEVPLSRNRKILKRRLSGRMLQEIGEEFGLTKESVRMILGKYIPDERLEEEKYKDIFRTYRIPLNVFTAVTGLDEMSYHYLMLTYGSRVESKTKNLFDMWFDTEINAEFKNSVFDTLKDGKASCEVRARERTTIIRILLKEKYMEHRLIDSFIADYADFIKNTIVSNQMQWQKSL